MTPLERARADERYQFLLARLFGRECITITENMTTTLYAWRGCVYIAKQEMTPEHLRTPHPRS